MDGVKKGKQFFWDSWKGRIFFIFILLSAFNIVRYLRLYGPILSTTVWPENDDQIMVFAEIATSPFTSKEGVYFLNLNNGRLTYWKPLESSIADYHLESWLPQKQQFLFEEYNRGEDRLFLTDKNGEFIEDLIFIELFWSRISAVSPEAEFIMVDPSANTSGDVYFQKIQNPSEKMLLDDSYSYAWPTWSPDGQKLLFTRNDKKNVEIVKSDKNVNNLDVLTQDGGGPLAWSPDGQMIAFVRHEQSLQDSLWVMQADGSHLHKILSPERDWDRVLDVVWTPDGQHIVYNSNKGGVCRRNYENSLICSQVLYMIDVNTFEVTRLTHHKLFIDELFQVN
jgi:Tol biopolymer transport system component